MDPTWKTCWQGTRPFNLLSLANVNVAQSVTLQGNGTYQLKPVIDVEPLTGTGSLSGKVVDASGAPMGALVNV